MRQEEKLNSLCIVLSPTPQSVGHLCAVRPCQKPSVSVRTGTDEDGRFWFRSVKPAGYPVPTDGPVGDLLRAQRRHPYRPAHLHFLGFKPGYKTLITQEMLTYKRPGTGISPKHMGLVVGRTARTDIADDTTLTWEMV